MWDSHLGQLAGFLHHIDLVPDAKPHQPVTYCAAIHKCDIEKADVDRMANQVVIFLAPLTDWIASVVFAAKTDSKIRLCRDYRRLNAMAIRDAYSIPKIDECIDSQGGVKIFSILYANSGTGRL